MLDELEDKPPKLWKKIMRGLVKEREDEGEKVEEKLGQGVTDSVVEWCEENISVEMKLEKE